MDVIFLKLFNMSICAGWLILAVIALRLVLRRAPKWTRCVLWAFVAVRLICPFSFESIFSLMPSAQTIAPADVQFSRNPEIHSGVSAIDDTLNPVIRESFKPNPAASINPLHLLATAAGIVWLIGLMLMLGYALFSFRKLRRRVSEAVLLWEGIYVCDNVRTPFILGIIRPTVYLPSGMEQEAMRYVLAHERAHLARRDHWWKALGFLLLAVYWFHPLVWAAYTLFCRDIELACDERAVKNWNLEKKKAYSHALVSCSTQKKTMPVCPLAFGEVGVKERVKAVLHYKKPAFWVLAASGVLCALVAVCFLTNPIGQAKEGTGQTASRQDADDGDGTQPPLNTDADQPQRADGPDDQTPLPPDPMQENGSPDDAQAADETDASQAQAASGADMQSANGSGTQGTDGSGTQGAGASGTAAPDKSNDGTAGKTQPSDAAGSPAAATGYPLYDSLIATAARVLAHPTEEEYEYERTLFTSAYFYSEMSWQTPGYLLMDLDGNGVDELLFGENHDDSYNGIVYNIYTISNGKLVRIVDGWERSRYYLCENGCIANAGSGSASESSYSYYTYKGTALTPVESVVHNSRLDQENQWLYASGDLGDESALSPISEDEARRIMDKYVYVLPQFTPFVRGN